MNHEITHGPSFAMLRVDLAPGDTVIADAGAMVARNTQVGMQVRMNARKNIGFFGKVKGLAIAFVRKFVGGETFFVNHFSTQQGPGSVWFAPTMSGSISHRRLNGETIILHAGAYLASTGDLDTKMKWGGLRGLLSKEGLFFLEISGQGDVWFTSYGGILPIDVNGTYTIDTGHIVGWEGPLTFQIRTPGGGALGFFASGEGLVCEFQGQGRVYIQSRNVSALVQWISPLLPG